MNPIFPQLCAGKLTSASEPRYGSLMLAAVLLLLPLTSHGDSATWKAAPGSGDWNTASNWTPATVPNGSSDTATFSISSIVGVSISQNVDLAEAVFTAGASAYKSRPVRVFFCR